MLGSGAGPDVGGYRSELERTIIVGNPAEAEKRFNAMMKLREAALNAMGGPGVKVRDIDAAVRRTARELGGLMDYLRHHVGGHGLGIEGGHEAPFLDIGYEGGSLGLEWLCHASLAFTIQATAVTGTRTRSW